MTHRLHLLNANIDNYSMQETLDKIEKTIASGYSIHHVVVNAAKIVAMQENIQLRTSVNQADLINADGQAVVWASKILGEPLKERVAGIDLMTNLVELAHKNKYKIFFFGAKEAVVYKVVDTYTKKYSKDIIAGYRNGYYTADKEQEIANQIAHSGAQILFVAISSPTKELFLHRHKDLLSKLNFVMGVGGSFDVEAGLVNRAPIWMQNIGLEWLYRLLQEPKRMWKRYAVGNTKFILLVFKAWLNR